MLFIWMVSSYNKIISKAKWPGKSLTTRSKFSYKLFSFFSSWRSSLARSKALRKEAASKLISTAMIFSIFFAE